MCSSLERDENGERKGQDSALTNSRSSFFSLHVAMTGNANKERQVVHIGVGISPLLYFANSKHNHMIQSFTEKGSLKLTAQNNAEIIVLHKVKDTLNRCYAYKNSIWVPKAEVTKAENVLEYFNSKL